MKIPSWLQSSQDSNKVSLSVKGFLTGLIPLIVILVKVFQIDIAEAQINEIIDTLGNTVIVVWTAVSAIITLYGLIRKLFKK